MEKVVGNWLMEIAKYIATALILSTVMSDKEYEASYYVICIGLLALIVTSGLFLLWESKKKDKKDKKRKK
jgi:general stress protein CsbA